MSRPIYLLAGQSNAILLDMGLRDPEIGIGMIHVPEFTGLEINGANDTSLPVFAEKSDFQRDAVLVGDRIAAHGSEFAAALSAVHGAEGFYSSVVAINGTALTYAQSKDNWYGPDGLYTILVNRILAIQAYAEAQGEEVHLAGIVWVQGEADARDVSLFGADPFAPGETMAERYGAALAQMVADLRADLAPGGASDAGIAGHQDFEFVISQLALSSAALTHDPHWAEVIAAQQAVAANLDHVSLVDPDWVAQRYDLGLEHYLDRVHYRHLTVAEPLSLTKLLLEELVAAATGTPLPEPDRGAEGIAQASAARDLVNAQGDPDLLVSYGASEVANLIDLQGLHRARGDAAGDLLLGVTRLEGGSAADTFFGNALGNGLYGGDGADLIYGRSGADDLLGGAGQDRLFGGAGADMLRGDADDDRLLGGGGDDQLEGGDGADLLRG
ncbi:MAG: sialate O-acetylesterase, partial [Pseudomonadota bacterium]